MRALYGGLPYEEAVKQAREAERRVRAGEARAEVARSLGIPLSTLSGWAHRGGWRRKDLVAVRDAERGQAVLHLIAGLTAAEREARLENAAKLREAIAASQAELDAVAPPGQLPGAMGEGAVPAPKLAMSLADSLLRQGRLEEADRAVRLAVRFTEAEQAGGAREESKWREERERLTKWWAEKQTAYHKLHQVALLSISQMEEAHALEDSRSENACCPRCGRRMDFWPEEIERPDDDDDDDSGNSAANNYGYTETNDDFARDYANIGARYDRATGDDDDSGVGQVDDDFPSRPPNEPAE